jgi:endonuclease/exonuclease/phosphatase family metal-dependent hydrolase
MMSARLKRSARKMALWAYVLTVALFAAGYVARHVSPEVLWVLQLIAIGLPVVAGVVVLTVPVVLSRSIPLMLVHLMAVTLITVRFGAASVSLDPDTGGADLKIMTFNLPYGLEGDRQPRLGQVMDVVRRERPHVLGFQEAVMTYDPDGTPLSGRRVIRHIVDSLGYVTAGPVSREATQTQAPLVTALEMGRVRFLDLPGGETAQAVRAEFRVAGKDIVLYNVHLQSYGTRKPWRESGSRVLDARLWRDYFRQYRRAIRLRSYQASILAEQIAAETRPIIVLGDFNATQHNHEYGLLAKGLVDTYDTAGNTWGGTYHAKFPVARIDFILVSPEFDIVDARVLNARLSDHLSLVATVRLAR